MNVCKNCGKSFKTARGYDEAKRRCSEPRSLCRSSSRPDPGELQTLCAFPSWGDTTKPQADPIKVVGRDRLAVG